MTDHETPEKRIAREKHAAAADPHETSVQLRTRKKLGHFFRKIRTAAKEIAK